MIDLRGWVITGPKFKGTEQYLSRDGTNPEAPWPEYGWPLGSECWIYWMEGFGLRLAATGLTQSSALERMLWLVNDRRRFEKLND